jgi:uncharacterized iron-regulated membrane protein
MEEIMSMPLLLGVLSLLGIFAVLGGLFLWRAVHRAVRNLPACNDDFHWL